MFRDGVRRFFRRPGNTNNGRPLAPCFLGGMVDGNVKEGYFFTARAL